MPLARRMPAIRSGSEAIRARAFRSSTSTTAFAAAAAVNTVDSPASSWGKRTGSPSATTDRIPSLNRLPQPGDARFRWIDGDLAPDCCRDENWAGKEGEEVEAIDSAEADQSGGIGVDPKLDHARDSTA